MCRVFHRCMMHQRCSTVSFIFGNIIIYTETDSVADPGCLSRIPPDPTFFHPGSSSKNLSILTQKKAKKWFLSSKKYDPGCSSRIRMLTFSHPGSRIQRSKRYPIPDPDPQQWKRIDLTRVKIGSAFIARFWL